jgi:polysaccharide export outer membrane protein
MRILLTLPVMCIAIIGSSCATKPQPIVTSALPEPEVRLDAGDSIEVKFPYHPELNEELTIRPDGKISLQMVDTLDVAGMTPEELDEELTKRYTEHITNPSLTVIVRGLASQRVFVGGEVDAPGEIPINGRLSVLEAVLMAGGQVRETAKSGTAVVIRYADNKRHATVVDLSPALKGKPHQPFLLAPNDIVLVPRTRISRANQWVDQYINDLLPATFLRFERRRGDTSIGYGR